MKCFVFFSLGLAMAFPYPQYRDAEEVENQMTGMFLQFIAIASSRFHLTFESNNSTVFSLFLGLMVLYTC